VAEWVTTSSSKSLCFSGSTRKTSIVFLWVDPQNIHRWRHQGLGIYQADVITINLGRHRVELWSERYELSVPTEEEVAAAETVHQRARRPRPVIKASTTSPEDATMPNGACCC
jgi:hypothetical protein